MADQGKITIHNKISANFRELHVDGAYGGLTPRGLINLNFYAERAPIPRSSEFSVVENKVSNIPLKHSPDSKEGILREYEFGIYMDLAVTKSIIELLQTKIAEYERATSSIK